jgi:hypothetical protein
MCYYAHEKDRLGNPLAIINLEDVRSVKQTSRAGGSHFDMLFKGGNRCFYLKAPSRVQVRLLYYFFILFQSLLALPLLSIIACLAFAINHCLPCLCYQSLLALPLLSNFNSFNHTRFCQSLLALSLI